MDPRSIFRLLTSCSLLLVLLWLAGCASGKEVILTKGDDGSTLTLDSGQALSIQLESNPTTGYSWAVLAVDPAVLEAQGELEYVKKDSGQQRVGAGGLEILRFRPVAAGQTRLTLGYRRPWEENTEPVESFSVEITVR
jgi:inhibitor of cysteine peptidase